MIASAFDQNMMVRALELAALGKNTTTPNPCVGCVIVDTNKSIIGEGFHLKAGSAHAEVIALDQARQNGHLLKGATVYVTLEPCSHQGRTPPCAQALIEAGIARLVFAMEDPNPQVSGEGLSMLEDAGVEVEGPLEEDAARGLNCGFIKRMTQGLPYVRIKSAMSLDGRTAMASGESKWVTGPSAREDVQRLRAQSCAIVTGVESIIHDDSALTVRLDGEVKKHRQALRVILDTHGRCPDKAQALEDDVARTVLVHGESHKSIIEECSDSQSKQLNLGEANFDKKERWYMPEREGRIDIYKLLRRLAKEGCNEVLVETGATLSGAFVASGLTDEFIVYMAPKLMGSKARPLYELPINKMLSSLPLTIEDIRAVGPDWRITAKPDPDG